MPRIDPLPREELGEVSDILAAFDERNGFAPNAVLTLGHMPNVVKALHALIRAIDLDSDNVSRELKNLVAQVASKSSGCTYCWAHQARMSEYKGVSPEKEDALWEYETSPLFTDAERAALRVAQGAGQVPNAVSDEDFVELKKYYSDKQIVEIVAMISMMAFYNRFNDTMATELESTPIAFGKDRLASQGWELGKHGG